MPHRNSNTKFAGSENHRSRRMCAKSSMSQAVIEGKGLLALKVERWTVECRCSLMEDGEDVAVDSEEAS